MLIEQATKEQLAECARLLALNLAHHQSLHGEIPLDETLALLDVTAPNAAQAKLLTNGMVNLIGFLAASIHSVHSANGQIPIACSRR